jgi:hypothetical protein
MTIFCYTNIVVYGDDNDIAEFTDYLSRRNGGFSFKRIIPCPCQFEYIYEGERRHDLGPVASDWRREHWGTNSIVEGDNVEMRLYRWDGISVVNIGFATVGNSPFPVLDKIAQQWSKLDFIFRAHFEPGAGTVIDDWVGEDTYIAQYQAGHGFSNVLIEKCREDGLFHRTHLCSYIDIDYTDVVSPLFLEQWGRDDGLKKAMMVFGYDDEAHTALVIGINKHCCEALVG